MNCEEKAEEYAKEKISDMKVNGFTLLEIAHLSNGANIYNPKVEHLLYDKIKQAYLDVLSEGRKEIAELKAQNEKMQCCGNCKQYRWTGTCMVDDEEVSGDCYCEEWVFTDREFIDREMTE